MRMGTRRTLTSRGEWMVLLEDGFYLKQVAERML
jgi:hypothetical protein